MQTFVTENWPFILGFVVVVGYLGWFFLSGETIGTVSGTTDSPWGGTHAARISVRTGGGTVRIAMFGSRGVIGVCFTREEALGCAEALERAAKEAVS